MEVCDLFVLGFHGCSRRAWRASKHACMTLLVGLRLRLVCVCVRIRGCGRLVRTYQRVGRNQPVAAH